jgi:hypothetical protein
METLVGLKVSYSDIGQYTILEQSEKNKFQIGSFCIKVNIGTSTDMLMDKDRDMVF